MMRALVAAALVSAPAPAAAVTLWKNLQEGMSKAEVKALHPAKAVDLSPGCRAAVDFGYRNKQLSTVSLENAYSSDGNSCARIIEAALLQKYGTPKSSDADVSVDDCSQYPSGKLGRALQSLCRPSVTVIRSYYWLAAGLQITLTLRDGSDDIWKIAYRKAVRVAPDVAESL